MLTPGCLGQVKWDNDWWQAKIKKVKLDKSADKIDKVYVRFVARACRVPG